MAASKRATRRTSCSCAPQPLRASGAAAGRPHRPRRRPRHRHDPARLPGTRRIDAPVAGRGGTCGVMARYDIAGLKARLEGLRMEDNPALVRQKSRDFYWYSPTLKRQLEAAPGDIVVSPTSEAEVVRVLEAAYALGIP